MKVQAVIDFIMNYNHLIIQSTVLVTLSLIVFQAVRLFRRGPIEEGAGSGVSPQLEEALKQILEKAQGIPSVSQAAGSAAEPLVQEIQTLKAQLEAKQIEIQQLAATSVAAGSNGAVATEGAPPAAASNPGLEAQIAELQAKLAEYEIISEDIADLSFYKEQNAKLQKEVEALQAQKATAPPVSAAAPAAVAAAVAPAAPPTPVATESVTTVEAPPVTVAATSPTFEGGATPEEKIEPPPRVEDPVIDDDLMAEFALAVAEQKGEAMAEPEAAATAAFEAPPEPEQVTEEKNPESDLFDFEKMASEATSLQEQKVDEKDVNLTLSKSLNENKLLEEAQSLGAAQGDDGPLMGEFEKFVNKG